MGCESSECVATPHGNDQFWYVVKPTVFIAEDSDATLPQRFID